MRYSQIKQALLEAEIIDEVSMSPTSLEKFANSPEAEGMLIGIEWEMCVPNTNAGDEDYDQEPDYDANQSAGSIDEIINFFREGDYSNLGRSGADRLRSEMWDLYLDWSYETIDRNLDEGELDNRIRSRLDDEIDKGEMSDLAHQRWVEDNPDKDPNSEEAAAEIRELTLDINEKTLDDMMADTQSSEYQYAYDEARQEIVDEMREDSDYDQEAWLTDIGVEDMQDAERHWGLDWPYYTEHYGSEDQDVDQVADDFYGATGYQAQGYNNYHAASRTDQQKGGYFIIEPDGSIDADSGDAGLEFISPAMPLKDGLAMIEKVKKWAKGYGCYTNKSTGLHMNISVPNMTIDNLDYVKLALFLGDDHILSEFGRTYNSYAKSAMKIVKEKIEQNPENATALLAKMKEHLGAAASKLVHSGVTQKYTSINTKDKYVEFRGPGGDYLDQDIPKLVNTALRAAQALRIATDDSAYKQEYAKKLYKLIGPEGEWTDPNNSVALFSRYALGQINKSELVSNVRQAQTARKEKKGEDQQFWVMNKDGTGGKQMVHANSSTEAIIKGGKQLGMKREESISKLKAEPFERLAPGPAPTKPAPESMTGGWKDWIENKAPKAEVNELLRIERELKAGQFDYLDDASTEYLLDYINELIEFRKQGDNAPPESLSQSWKDWVEDTLPTVTVDTINSVRQRIINGGDQLSAPAEAWIIRRIDSELDRRQNGTVDNNETRWKVTLDIWENTAYRNVEPVYVDADSPRQAKVKAKELFQREAGLDVPLNHMEAIATTADAGAVHAIPQSWRDWVDTIINRRTETIADFRRQIEQGDHNNTLGSQAQRDAVIRVIDDELRRRQDQGETGEEKEWSVRDGLGRYVGTVNATTRDEALRIYGSTNNVDTRTYTAALTDDNPPHAAGATTSREVFDSLASVWQDWLQDISSKSGSDLQRVIDNMAAGVNAHYTNLDVTQKDFIINTVNQELRRRSAANGTAWTSSNAELAANAGSAENNVRESLPTAHREWLENIRDHSDMSLINVLNNIATTTTLNEQQAAYFRVTIKHELRRRGINPDEATPSPTTTYADDADERERMRREREQISQDMATQTNESISLLRKLAGLN